jgi:hypothetical protein
VGKDHGKDYCQIHGENTDTWTGSVYITTTVAPLKQELLYQKEKIIERVNEVLGANTVKEVVIK